jgi:hypothetical protein
VIEYLFQQAIMFRFAQSQTVSRLMIFF